MFIFGFVIFQTSMNVPWAQTAMAVNTHASTRPDLIDVNATVDFY